MTDIKITFTYENEAGDGAFHDEEFFVDGSLESTIQDHIEEWIEDNGDYTFVEREIIEWEDDFDDPHTFDDLDEYGAYVEKCEEHGEGYRLRYADVGDFDFDDEYNGGWDSEEFLTSCSPSSSSSSSCSSSSFLLFLFFFFFLLFLFFFLFRILLYLFFLLLLC